MARQPNYMERRRRAAKQRRRNAPLRVRLVKGLMTIEIGVDTLAFSTLRSPYVYGLAGDQASREDMERRFKITNSRGFAIDVKRELLAEAEDGSSLLTKLLDDACTEAIEQGAEHFIDTEHDE